MLWNIHIQDVFRKIPRQIISRGGPFFQFRGLIFCNPKRLQFCRNKKNKNTGAQFKTFSITQCRNFLLMELLILFASHHFFLFVVVPLSFFMDSAFLKFTQISWCIKFFNSGKNWRAHF